MDASPPLDQSVAGLVPVVFVVADRLLFEGPVLWVRGRMEYDNLDGLGVEVSAARLSAVDPERRPGPSDG